MLAFALQEFVFADSEAVSHTVSSIASRNVDGAVYYYDSLHEAFEAAAGISIDLPDELILLSDITVDEPLIVENEKHIRLVPGNGDKTIKRGDEFLEYPIFWITGDGASLALGRTGMEYQLTIDGGFLNNLSIQAHAPLITLNGLDSKLIMYDNVILQNNYNISPVLGDAASYQHGAGVFVRTRRDSFEPSAEFVMKGGIIRGNVNNTGHSQSHGGGVHVIQGIFTMEGGVITDNTTKRNGGGVYVSRRASFKKTGGIIYGNTALGNRVSKFSGHAVSVDTIENSVFRFRDNTVKENERLTYTASITGDGVFGKGEKWQDPNTLFRRNLLIGIIMALLLGFLVFVFLRKKVFSKKLVSPELVPNTVPKEKSPALLEAETLLTNREKDVFYMFLSGKTAKQISQALNCSVSNINNHSEKIYRKLNVNSYTELLFKFK
jgi:DNA-binding CsgD family transcriptional regulator